MTEHKPDIHVYPIDGQQHILDGLTCWCFPIRDEEKPSVVVHNDLSDDDNCV